MSITYDHTDRAGRPVTLHAVDADNWRAVADRAPRDDQRDRVPAPAARYLVLTSREDTWNSLAVPAGDQVTGHIMRARDEDGSHWLGGMLIDASHQGRGIGAAAVRTLTTWLSDREGHPPVRLSCTPSNEAAAHLYARLGFRLTGVEEDGEVVAEWAGAG
ncbi:GNAT family N-acetyltransferase [Streptomyces sp. YIM 132580]|uniref:GNAT family N-acetyltransferase n=1 Tax=Streptomyces sp. YIM 132580 TaxID=2691958 RepID=UPI0013699798|nr:GNAT family N-acetyltransferase [Streptomyces sp. YIM 132580]MXG28254.1 GNAT family N-acetyltransferase [Streptomyces sp. YIM 132580]